MMMRSQLSGGQHCLPHFAPRLLPRRQPTTDSARSSPHCACSFRHKRHDQQQQQRRPTADRRVLICGSQPARSEGMCSSCMHMYVRKPQVLCTWSSGSACGMTLTIATVGRRTYSSTSSQHIGQRSLCAARHQHWAVRPSGGPAAGLGAAALPEPRASALVSVHHQ